MAEGLFTLITGVGLAIFMLLYLKIAKRFNIIDRPNHRSSHDRLVVRGGGIIFFLAAVLFETFFGFPHPYFLVGLVIISLISFYDDLYNVSGVLRIGGQLVAVILLSWQLKLLGLPTWSLILVFVMAVGTLNAYNFMDGINGMTGIYSLTALTFLLFINQQVTQFVPPAFLIIMVISVVIFGYFNFRKNAVCFAGDVGSISIAYVILFLVVALIQTSSELSFVLFFAVYGVDSVLTIVHRLLRRENIFKAHRSHLYQYFANQNGSPHLKISAFYGFTQALVNTIILFNFQHWNLPFGLIAAIVLIPLSILYIYLKYRFEQKFAIEKSA